MGLEEEIREFLIECNEYMEVLDRDILLLEENPEDQELISSVFRAIHTIKGTCGFFGFDSLGSLTHLVETILGQVRERERILSPQLVSIVLEALDVIRVLLNNIETSGLEGADITGPLRARLEEVAQTDDTDRVLLATSSGEEDVAESLSLRSEEVAEAPESPSVRAHGSSHPAPAPASSSVLTTPEQLRHNSKHAARSSISKGITPVTTSTPTNVPATEKEVTQQSAREANKEAHLAESTIRVDVALLNRLMNLVGELVLARNQLLQDASSQHPAMQQTSQRLNLITSELQEGVMKTRMQPIGVVWNKLPRVVRDLAAQCGKLVRIEMEGAGTELDKTIIEAIKDPLTHIVRNSCDHGIETPDIRNGKGKTPEGLLLLRAYHEGGVVNIEISDDGTGIDPQRVKDKAIEKGLIRPEQATLMSDRDAVHLIFLPGFSTAAQISAVSGRGVGMDVVKTNIEKIGGNVELLNRADGGTTIRIKIPLTLAIIPGLVVGLDVQQAADCHRSDRSEQERFIIPQANLLELVRIEEAEMKKRIENVHGTPVFHHRGKLIPLIYLAKILRTTVDCHKQEAINVVVLQAESKQLGLVVDSIWDTQEIVVKPLGRQLKGLSCYVGATIMGDGRPALILDVAGLARLARLGLQTRPPSMSSFQLRTPLQAEPQMMLLFQTRRYERMAVPLGLVDRLEEIKRSQVEHSGGRPVLHYRGEILPLLSIDPTGFEVAAKGGPDSLLQIIVFTNGPLRVGLLVERILDIVHETISGRRLTAATNVLGSAVIGGKITDLLDLSSLVASTGEDWFASHVSAAVRRDKLLLIEGSIFSRELLRERLVTSGYDVISVRCATEALLKAHEQSGFAAILFGSHEPEEAGEEMLSTLRTDELLSHLPLVRLVDDLHQSTDAPPFLLHCRRSDITGLLETLSALVQADAKKEAA